MGLYFVFVVFLLDSIGVYFISISYSLTYRARVFTRQMPQWRTVFQHLCLPVDRIPAVHVTCDVGHFADTAENNNDDDDNIINNSHNINRIKCVFLSSKLITRPISRGTNLLNTNLAGCVIWKYGGCRPKDVRITKKNCIIIKAIELTHSLVMNRRKPFSSKQKKKQLQDKRRRKQGTYCIVYNICSIRKDDIAFGYHWVFPRNPSVKKKLKIIT